MKLTASSQEFSVRLRRVTALLQGMPRRLLLHYSRWLEVGLLILTLMFLLTLTVWLLYFLPRQVVLQPSLSAPLATAALDELKVWAEQRQRAFDQGMIIPDRPLFVD